MKTSRSLPPSAALVIAACAAIAMPLHAQDAPGKPADKAAAKATARPALTVSVVRPQSVTLPLRVWAGGNIAAWQEASVGAETNGWRIAEVRVNVGDAVRKGQVLATFASAMAQADLAQTRAAVAEAESALAEAEANARRARDLQATGALSQQQIDQFLTAERSARARLEAQRAAVQVQQIRLAQTSLVAPDSGVISARSATVGAVVPAGQELFRLIRQGRLEWRAEVAATDIGRIKPGQAVQVTPAGGAPSAGRVRMVAPTVDPATRNGIVYVDLPQPGAAKAGMYARGEFEIGASAALTLPQGAVLLRDGFAYVFVLGADARVAQSKVTVGRRVADRIEITQGLKADAQVVAAGGAFLADGDLVRVVDAPAR